MIDLDKLQKDLTKEDIINIMTDLGADRVLDTNGGLIFPTICHNEFSEEASMKLYYYFDNHIFRCYTECDEVFNIFTLIDKRFKLLGYNRVDSYDNKKEENDYTFYDILQFIIKRSNISLASTDKRKYRQIRNKYLKKEEPELIKFNNNILNLFDKYYPVEWLKEDISKTAMDKFNIRYSVSRNQIIIPHYDINGNLIGIRGRTLNEEEAEEFGKYRPIEIEGVEYAHPLSLNLYGIYENKEAIKRIKRVILLEGEKSVLKGYNYYGNNNISLAVCGSHINKRQIDLLIKNFDINEIIIGFDKEYETQREYVNYLVRYSEACKKYKNYCNFSIVMDKNNLLDLKDSPIDKGKEVFEQLIRERVEVM